MTLEREIGHNILSDFGLFAYCETILCDIFVNKTKQYFAYDY